MQLFFRIATLFVLNVGCLYAQLFQIPMEESSGPSTVLDINENYFVLLGYRSSSGFYIKNYTIKKYDKTGREQITKTIGGNEEYSKLIKTDDDALLMVSTIGAGLNREIKILKLDVDLNTLWEKCIPVQNEKFSSIIQDTDTSLLIVTILPNESTYVRKLDKYGENMWAKTISDFTLQSLCKIDNYFFAFCGKELIKFSNELEFIAQYIFPDDIDGFIPILNSNIFIYFHQKNFIIATDLAGNITNTFYYTYRVYALNKSADNNLILTLSNHAIIKSDRSGNILWIIENTGNIGIRDAVFPLQDNSLILYINLTYKYLVKCTSEGFYKFLEMPTFFPETSFDYQRTITWKSKNVNEVDISYSDYEGKITPLVTNYNSGTNQYTFYIPKNLKAIIINDSDEPNIIYSSQKDYGILGNYPHYDFFSVNNIKMWVSNRGSSGSGPSSGGAGLYWKNSLGSYVPLVFNGGIYIGGIDNGNIKVVGSGRFQGLQPGRIINGNAAGYLSENYSPFKILKNWQSLPEGIEKENYKYCYFNWPVHLGAEWSDRNVDGIYTIGIDEPKFIGDEVIFYVANDLNTTLTNATLGCDPLSLEFHTTVFGFDSTNFLADVVFTKYMVINKSGNIIEDAYLCYYSDDDLGTDFSNDFVGCDSSLSLAYTWNRDNFIDEFFGVVPSAIGYKIVQGPIVPSDITDKAKFNNEWRDGFSNLPATAFAPDWNMEFSPNNEGARKIYEYVFKGLNYNWRIPEDYINPHTGVKSLFPLSGDPESGTGWFEGVLWPGGINGAGDRRLWLTSGPFNITPNDTQEIVIATIVAQGNSNLNSITELKNKARLIQNFYDSFNPDAPNQRPLNFELMQNFPNPFNPATTIRYLIKENTHVRIKLFDVLGREITTLVDEYKLAWSYDVKFDGSNLASGVYIYRLEAGDFIQSKKMILLK